MKSSFLSYLLLLVFYLSSCGLMGSRYISYQSSKQVNLECEQGITYFVANFSGINASNCSCHIGTSLPPFGDDAETNRLLLLQSTKGFRYELLASTKSELADGHTGANPGGGIGFKNNVDQAKYEEWIMIEQGDCLSK